MGPNTDLLSDQGVSHSIGVTSALHPLNSVIFYLTHFFPLLEDLELTPRAHRHRHVEWNNPLTSLRSAGSLESKFETFLTIAMNPADYSCTCTVRGR